MRWGKLIEEKGSGGMGFRGISDFNVSLLGKHFWRIQTGKSSLFAEVLKSIYYSNGSIQDVRVSHAPSYVWRRILCSREMVMVGSRWRIGNGSNVRIWRDNWLPKNVGFKVISDV